MRIGYSFWGFLGDGTADSRDNGRAWRASFIDALQHAGHDVVLLQISQDAAETATRFKYRYRLGYPKGLDALIVEWRSPDHRNTTPCDTPGHTCDLHRQEELLDHYTRQGLPTLVWDLGFSLPPNDPIRSLANVAIAEPAFAPALGAVALPLPVPGDQLAAADPGHLASLHRGLPLVYVGHQDSRHQDFAKYFEPVASLIPHQVAGDWTPDPARWPGINFTGPCACSEVRAIHLNALTTVLLSAPHHSEAGHLPSRFAEAILAGCLPLVPADITGAAARVPEFLIVHNSRDVHDRITWIRGIAGFGRHIEMLRHALASLQPLRSSTVAATAIQILENLT